MAQSKQKILKNAEKYTKKGHYEKAINEYHKLTQDDFGEMSLNNTIGDLLIRARNIQEAIVEYEKAGKYYEEKGFIPRALAIYKKILRYDPARALIYEKLAQLYSDQGLIQDAITQFEFLAKHYEHEGKTEAALDSYRQIADLDPSNLSIRERLATLYAQRGFQEKSCLERVKIGEGYMKRGENVTAIKSFEAALEEMPDNEEALRGIVKVYLAEKRVKDAKDVLKKILDSQSSNISALTTLGRICMDAGELDEAIEHFNRVNQLDPSQEGITEILGRIYILQGNYQEAFHQLKEIINEYIEHTEFDRALGILNQLQEIAPNNIPVREKKVEIYQKLNKHEDAKVTFREIAEIYYGEEQLDEAYNIYERLFSMDPHDNDIKQRFNQISMELKGRPIEVKKGAKPVKPAELTPPKKKTDEPEKELVEIGSEKIEIDTSSNALESLFDTSELEKISIPIFGEDLPLEVKEIKTDEIAEDIFSVDSDILSAERIDISDVIEPSEDQIREFKIEAGVFMKYGLLEKAADRLKSILVIQPEDDESLEKLMSVYQKMGNMEKYVQTVLARVKVYNDKDLQDKSINLLKESLEQVPESAKLKELLDQYSAAAPADVGGDMQPLISIEPVEAGSDMAPLVDLTGAIPDTTSLNDSETLVDMEAVVQDGMVTHEETGEQVLANDLADVVKEFREDLVSRSDQKGLETHYNLGIAYLEMGLLDEAVEEFKLTVEAPDYLVKSSGLMAQCFIQKNESTTAITVLKRAIENSKAEGMELLNLKYELALANKGAGDVSQSLSLFKEIQKEKKNFRDVKNMIAELKKA